MYVCNFQNCEYIAQDHDLQQNVGDENSYLQFTDSLLTASLLAKFNTERYIHSHSHSLTLTLTLTYPFFHLHVHTFIRSHIYTSIYTFIHAYMITFIYPYIYTHTHFLAHFLISIYTYIHSSRSISTPVSLTISTRKSKTYILIATQ